MPQFASLVPASTPMMLAGIIATAAASSSGDQSLVTNVSWNSTKAVGVQVVATSHDDTSGEGGRSRAEVLLIGIAV